MLSYLSYHGYRVLRTAGEFLKQFVENCWSSCLIYPMVHFPTTVLQNFGWV